MQRRAFLASVAGATAVSFARRARAAGDAGRILTVRGPVDPRALGTALVHEHVLVDFIGADRVSPDRYDAEEVFQVALPHLVALRERGCQAFFEATPAYLGRDPLLLRRLSEASGLHLVTNTGYYGAAKDKHVPAHAYRESARELADRWTREFRRGLDGTGVRPGFLKIGVDAGPLSEIDRKLVEAGALCHLDTGLTIAVHTGDGTAGLEILATLRERGVSPEAWVWVHAQNAGDRATQDWAARQGAWLELDGVGWGSLEGYLDAVVELKYRGRLDRVLLSQDAGWYHVGEPGGGDFRPFTGLFDEFVPALRARGLTEEDIQTLLVHNPARAFAVGVRRLEPSAGGRS
jgi:phosphotriesterase-related protein